MSMTPKGDKIINTSKNEKPFSLQDNEKTEKTDKNQQDWKYLSFTP